MSPSDAPRADATDDSPVTGDETRDAAAPVDGSDAEPSTGSDAETEAEPRAESAVEPEVPAADAANRRLVPLFATAAVVVLVVVGVIVYLLTRDDASDTAGSPEVPTIEGSAQPTSQAQAPPAGSTSPLAPQSSASATAAAGTDAGAAQSVAEQAASAISKADVATLVQLSCDPTAAAEGSDEDTFPTDATVEVVGEPQITGDTATVDVRVTLPGAEPATVPMPLTKQGERWCIP